MEHGDRDERWTQGRERESKTERERKNVATSKDGKGQIFYVERYFCIKKWISSL